jgi:protoporphyrinogen/coproporphyrinogen III oxidase
MKKTLIIGAGISGLTLAWKLKSAGHPITIMDASSCPGGAIQSIRAGNWLAEAGPNSIQDSDTAVSELVASVGLTSRLLEASTEAKRRYIVRNRKPQLVPIGPLTAIKTPLFSLKAKLGLLGEPFRARPSDPGLDESLAAFVRRRLGPEFLDYAINPMVGGIYAGNPETLSVKHAFSKVHALEAEFGSLIRGAIGRIRQRKKSGEIAHKKRVLSFPDGLSELTNTIASKLGPDLYLNTTVTSITRQSNSTFVVDTQPSAQLSNPGSPSLPPTQYDTVVFAATTHAMDAISFLGFDDLPNPGLSSLPYAPVVSLTLGFPRDAIAHPLDGFGVLVPEIESMNILGCLFTSSIFPHRAPDAHITLTVFVGGMRNPDLTRLSDPDLQQLVLTDLNTLLGVSKEPVFIHQTRWTQAIPQYEIGFNSYLERMQHIENMNPGFYFVGNYRTGISLDACIRTSWNHPLTQNHPLS